MRTAMKLGLGAALVGAGVWYASAFAQNGGGIKGIRDVCVGESVVLKVVPPSAAGKTTWECDPPGRVTFSDSNTYNQIKMTGATPSILTDDVLITATFTPVTANGNPKPYVWKQHVTVVDVDVKTFRPKVIDDSEGEADRDKMQAWVNLDNDDESKKFDIDENDTPADNELGRVEIVLMPSDYDKGKVTVEVEGGAPNAVKLWKSNKKDLVALPLVLDVKDDMAPDGDYRTKKLWLEGVLPHTKQQDTTIKATFSNGTAEKEAKNKVTVLGVKTIKFKGKENSVKDDDTLDADPNWDKGAMGYEGVRVFPDARRDDTDKVGAKRPDVEVEVELTVKPVEKVKLNLRPFDIDDPSDETTFVDPNDLDKGGDYANTEKKLKYTANEDNRDEAGGRKSGKLAGQTGDSVEMEFEDVKKSIVYTVGLRPGDNYRLVANADKTWLEKLRNHDKKDKQHIVDPKVGDGAAGKIKDDDKYASFELAVWRICNFELDSMGKVGTEKIGDKTVKNYVEGVIDSIDNDDSKKVKVVTVEEELNKPNGVADGTLNLSDGIKTWPDKTKSRAPGRFQRGTLRIADTHDITNVDGNGTKFVQKEAEMDVCATKLPALVKDKDGAAAPACNVTKIDKKLELVTDSANNFDPAKFVGGTVSINGGPPMGVTAVIGGKTLKVSKLQIPYRLSDDDIADGTDVREIGEGADDPFDVAGKMNDYYRPMYVVFRKEKTGNESETAFVANIPGDSKAEVQTTGWSFNHKDDHDLSEYWCIYLRGSFQAVRVEDYDYGKEDKKTPREGLTLGIVDKVSKFGGANGQGANVYLEVFRKDEWPDKTGDASEHATTAHEIAHLFSCPHSDGGIMEDTDVFEPISMNRVRSIRNP